MQFNTPADNFKIVDVVAGAAKSTQASEDLAEFTTRVLNKRAEYEAALAARGVEPYASRTRNARAAAIEFARMVAITNRL